LKQPPLPVDETLLTPDFSAIEIEEPVSQIKERKTLKTFMDSFKNGLIDLFKEEGDAHL
jgi:NADPH-dependent 7-cyano-7-deazaguanine reductase QueF